MSVYNPNTNFNRYSGNEENIIEELNAACGTPEGNKNLLSQNAAFKQAIYTAIAAKNKADYPPLGPRDPIKRAFQQKKIECLLEAIKQTKNDGVTGNLTGNPTFLAGLGGAHLAVAGVNTLATWGMNTGRGIGRTIYNPITTARSTGTSIANLAGKGNSTLPVPVPVPAPIVATNAATPIAAPAKKGWFGFGGRRRTRQRRNRTRQRRTRRRY